MKYRSTRGKAKERTGARAIIAGIAEDRGLYVPEAIPALPFELKDRIGSSYRRIAGEILGTFFDDYTKVEMETCVAGAYDDKFEADDMVSLKAAGGANFLELYHGKTAAFKDMALSILPYLLTTAIKKEGEDKKICILTATSGDTGKAALEGFADVPGTEIFVFYPAEGVSQVQERQMVTQEGKNVHVFSIEGNFDDAQTGVKQIFGDSDLADRLSAAGCKLSSANSINIGRLVPQVAYYVYGYLKLVETGKLKLGDTLNIVVPTGNFGNILAAYYAKAMGVPLGKLICASNENKVLTDFIRTGVYDIRREFHLTNSPSMDILISSNVERLLYHLSGEDGATVSSLMEALEKEKCYTATDKIKMAMKDFYGGFCSEEDTNKAIGDLYRETGYLMDTHTAVAYKVYGDYKKETGDETPALIASTASAYKFAESVGQALGLPEARDGFEAVEAVYKATGVPVPSGLKDLDKKKVLHDSCIPVMGMKSAVEKVLM